MPHSTALIPCLRYRDAPVAIDWLDADAVHARARDAGAAMVVDIEDEGHGGRGFTCGDIEGHIWSVGTYAPAQ